MYMLLCEGPRCNNGIGSDEREKTLLPETFRSATYSEQVELIKRVRIEVSSTLALTPHTAVSTRYSTCDICGYRRVYGGTSL